MCEYVKQNMLPSPSWQQSVYWLGIGKAKDKPYKIQTSNKSHHGRQINCKIK